MASLTKIVQPATRFQRAVHIRYDLRDADAIQRYIPTLSAASAIETILRGTNPHGTQRAHVLHAAYGSGKSLLGVALAALVEQTPVLLEALQDLATRIEETSYDAGQLANDYLEREQTLMPVVLAGDEGDFTVAMTKALRRALHDSGIEGLALNTRFDAALAHIARWQTSYPHTIEMLSGLLQSNYDSTVQELSEALEAHDTDAFSAFVELYPQLTAGATFDEYAGRTPDVIYREVAEAIAPHGYNGIFVIWDEFGRYLEARTAQAFGNEAALLQSFAETCNYSGADHQLHFVVLAHKELQSYASKLPADFQQEWSRIEGRFQRHNVSSDALVAYRLIASAINHQDNKVVNAFLDHDTRHQLAAEASDAHLFSTLSLQQVEHIIARTWPLHPVTVYALTRLSNKVAQNERTMFTFLAVNERHALLDILDQIDQTDDDLLVYPYYLWDYFEDAIRSDIGAGGAHQVWSGVKHALDKVSQTDDLSIMVIKTLGILLLCSDMDVARPSTDFVAWAMGATSDEDYDALIATLNNLKRRKVIINRRVDGYWTFTAGSDVDFEGRLAETLERVNPSDTQLKRLLEASFPAPHTLARRYNQDKSMTRYFNGIYWWGDNLKDVPWDTVIEQQKADGVVVYVLVTDELMLKRAQQATVYHPQVIYVFPQAPQVVLRDALRELFGLQELNNDPTLSQQDDKQRVQREIDWLIEDAEVRLQREISQLTEPRQAKSTWVVPHQSSLYAHQVDSPGQTSRLVSAVCYDVFPATPVFNVEGLNKQNPTRQQSRAAEKVIEALFYNKLDPTLGLEGNGPEVLIASVLINNTGILRQVEGVYEVSAPSSDKHLLEVWHIIDDYLQACQEEPSSLASLVQCLQAPPLGIRMGVIPVLFAAVLRRYLNGVTLRQERRAKHPITGELITDIIRNADKYTLEIKDWSDTQQRLWDALLSMFENHIFENESRSHPLALLQVATLRWLQGLPSFCRDTRQLSEKALRFRDLIRVAQTEPGQVLFVDLPDVLEVDASTTIAEIKQRLTSLMTEISNAYLDLQRRLDSFAIHEFVRADLEPAREGTAAVQMWLEDLEATRDMSLDELRFSSIITQQFVETARRSADWNGQFWDQMSVAVTGVHLRDWTDKSETSFYEKLKDARDEIKREAEELHRDERVVTISLALPESGPQTYRFRSSGLSAQGLRILQNFKSTMEISGRPLTVDEKRQIAVAFLSHMMGEEIFE